MFKWILNDNLSNLIGFLVGMSLILVISVIFALLIDPLNLEVLIFGLMIGNVLNFLIDIYYEISKGNSNKPVILGGISASILVLLIACIF